jgi:hypothetical protein
LSTPSSRNFFILKSRLLLMLRLPAIFKWCCPKQSSQQRVGGKWSPWQQRARLPSPCNFCDHLDRQLSDFVYLAPLSPKMVTVSGLQKTVHDWSPRPLHGNN